MAQIRIHDHEQIRARGVRPGDDRARQAQGRILRAFEQAHRKPCANSRTRAGVPSVELSSTIMISAQSGRCCMI